MTDVLLIQSSSNLAGSVSRALAEGFVRDYVAAHPGTPVTRRDLVTDPIPHFSVDLFGGFFGQPEPLTEAQGAALAQSDALIGEVKAASLIVLGVPMYNFSIPSALKAWVDQIVRPRVTFAYTPEGPKGLLTGKKAVLCLASGGVYTEGPFKPYDIRESYLRGILGFMGITDVTAVYAEGLSMGPEAAAKASADAQARLAAIAL